MIKILKLVALIILILLLIVVGYFVYMTVTDYRPEEKVTLDVENNDNRPTLDMDGTYTATTYNIGYAGLDETADFFLDGGTKSRASSKETVENNMKGIMDYLTGANSDFFLLQEVDLKATRSFKVDEFKQISDMLSDYSSTFAINYKVPWVPVPISKPMGNVTSGIALYSKYAIHSSVRYQFPGEEPWPRQLALLDRCFIEARYPLSNGKDFIIINSHMSAYDASGYIREQQVGYLQNFLATEYDKGNYIVVGGDWNHELPGTSYENFNKHIERPDWLQTMKAPFPHYVWGADSTTPTNRSNEQAYVEGENFVSVIDGFLVSDNVEILDVQGTDLQFKHSDHHPVTLTFKLK